MSRLLEVRSIAKAFSGGASRTSLIKRLSGEARVIAPRSVLREISFDLFAGECVGIIGPNGAGKSTLLRIIAGILAPDSGTVTAHGSVLPLFTSSAGFTEDLEVIDNVFLFAALLGLSSTSLTKNLDRILEISGLTARATDQFRLLSPGMRARLAFAISAETSSNIIIVDELVAFGDHSFREWIAKRVKSWCKEGRAILHVSHDLSTITALSSRILRLENGIMAPVQDASQAAI